MPAEVERIRASVIANSRALEMALKHFRVGMKETELAAEIDYQNRKLGAEAPSFDTIVAAGERSALPHAHPGPAKIGPGILLIDMGAFRDGYASDMTRMAHVGPATPKYKRAYRAVLEAQLAAIDAVKPGVTTECGRPCGPRHAQAPRTGTRVRSFHRPRAGSRNPRTAAHRPQGQNEARSGHDNYHRAGYLYRRLGRHPHRRYGAGYR